MIKRTKKLKKTGTSPVSKTKKRIQALLRERAIERDGGCILRHDPDAAGKCGGYTKVGELILQGEHLNSRAHGVSFAEMDNIVCLCRNHHIFFKKKEPFLYQILVRAHIGERRWEKVEAWMKDKTPHRMTAKEWVNVEDSLKTK